MEGKRAIYINQRIPPKRHPCFFAHYLPHLPSYSPPAPYITLTIHTFLRTLKLRPDLSLSVHLDSSFSSSLAARQPSSCDMVCPFFLSSQSATSARLLLTSFLFARIFHSFILVFIFFFSPRNETKVWETSGGWCVT